MTVTLDKSIQTDDEQVNPSLNSSLNPSPVNPNELELSSKDTYVDALLNSRQLYINFEEVLKKLDKNLTMKVLSGSNKLLIRNSFEMPTSTGSAWKSKVANELKKFFTTKAFCRIVKIPNEVQANKQSMDLLRHHLAKTNKSYPALYLRLDGQTEISCHGTRNALMNKLQQFPDLFKKFLDKSYDTSTNTNTTAAAVSTSTASSVSTVSPASSKVTTPVEQEPSGQQSKFKSFFFSFFKKQIVKYRQKVENRKFKKFFFVFKHSFFRIQQKKSWNLLPNRYLLNMFLSYFLNNIGLAFYLYIFYEYFIKIKKNKEKFPKFLSEIKFILLKFTKKLI